MRSLLLVILAASLFGFLFFFLGSGSTADPLELSSGTSEAETSSPIDAESSLQVDSADQVARSEVETSENEDSDSKESEPTGPPWFTGRCLSAETGDALAAVNIRLDGWAASGMDRAEEGLDYQTKQAETDEEGNFVIHLEPHPKRQYRLAITGEDLASIDRNFAAGTLLEPTDLGDIYLQPGAGLDGRVIFENGEPIASLYFELKLREGSAKAAPAGFGYDPGRVMGTDDEGKFQARNLPLGAWDVMLGAGMELRSPDRVDTLGTGIQDIVLVASGDGTAGIKGFVRTEDGEALPGINVHAFSGFISSNARSKKDGSFELYGHGKVGEDVTIYQSTNDDQYEPVEQNLQAKWGDKELEVIFRRIVSTSLDLSVVDANTGRAVEDYAVRCFPTPFQNNKEGNKETRLSGVHVNGQCRIGELREGSNMLVILPEDPAYAPGKIVIFDLEPDVSTQLRVELEPAGELRVRVQDAAGNPIEGARVELLRSQADNPIAQRRESFAAGMLQVGTAAAAMSYEKMFTTYTAIEMVWRMARARTDQDGMVTIRSTVPAVAHALRASLDGRPSSQLDEVSFAENAGIHVITLNQGAGLELSFRPAELLDHFTGRGDGVGIRLLQVVSEGEDDPLAQPGRWDVWELPESGDLAKTGLLPGTWRLILQGLHQIGVGTYQTLETELTTIELVEGETLELTIDPSEFIPSRIRGDLRVAGKIPLNPRLMVRREKHDQGERQKEYYPNQVMMDSKGEFETPPLSPGPYSFQLSLNLNGANIGFAWTAAIELQANQDVHHMLEFAAAPLELVLNDANGKAVAEGSSVRLLGEGSEARISGKLGSEGRMLIEAAAPGSYRGRVVIAGESVSFESVQVVAGAKNIIKRRINRH